MTNSARFALLMTTTFGLPAFVGCGDAASVADPNSLDYPGVHIELGAGAADPTVRQDAIDLAEESLGNVEAFDPEKGHRMEIIYLGRGAFGPQDTFAPSDAPEGTSSAEDGQMSAMDGVNLTTGNEFRIRLSFDLLEAVGTLDRERGADLGTPGAEAAEPSPPQPQLPTDLDLESSGLGVPSLSNASDDRYRPYGVNAAVTNSVHRRIVKLGGCSGTLVGPRHVVTAGHCLWSRRNSRWSNNFTVSTARNGTSDEERLTVNRNNIPNGQVVWLFTPSQYRNGSSTTGYDFGVLTLPGRLGDTVGWMGRVTFSASSFSNTNIYRRGYPSCSATIRRNGVNVPRVDEPCSDNGAAGNQSCTCRSNHFYANAAFCSIGEYGSQDSSGWSRIIHHSCDASAGDSGSPLYGYFNGTASVAAVHVVSRCEVVASSHSTYNACTGSLVDRPLQATRLTPEYRDWIGYFRNRFP